ncbi:Six-hairpin glycosidase-like protein [Aspergillus cavernicola]|uniref:Six-hairpin glycosidase-like protein n=1 Tax=Aspergillus cavernicola TaxID=176166 RepID=A0ABR4I721_9EURO
MNKVWSWDNCFNALGIAPLSLNLAINQIQIMYDFQAPDGRLPNSIDWWRIEWAYAKPPIQGWVLAQLLHRYSGMQHRRTEKARLPWYCHGNDSGWDNSTAFDLQPVTVSPDCAAYLILQAEFLANLAGQLELGPEQRDMWLEMKGSVTKALLTELWDGESFLIKNAMTGETRKSTSLIRLLPLVAAKHLPLDVVDKMVADLSRHLTEWGLTAEEIESPLYDSDGYWRGPIWAPSTLRSVSCSLRETGFAENYDAVKGEGQGDLSHTWASSIFLVLAKQAFERKVPIYLPTITVDEKASDNIAFETRIEDRAPTEILAFISDEPWDLARLTSAAQDATSAEHQLTIREAIKLYPKAILFSIGLSLTIVMEGYDTGLMLSFFGLPQFRQKYGHELPNGDYQVAVGWQSGIGAIPSVGGIFGLLLGGLMVDWIGYRYTLFISLATLSGFIFVTFFAENILIQSQVHTQRTSALQRLHDIGILQGDVNRYNFIIQDDTVRLIDFEKSQWRTQDAVQDSRGEIGLIEKTGPLSYADCRCY